MKPASLLALALCPLFGACQYARDRWNDTLDVLPLSVTWGPGLYASANVTNFVGTGIGYYQGTALGWFPTEGPDAKEPEHLERFQIGDHMSFGLILGDYHFPDPGRMDEYGILYWFIPKTRKGGGIRFPFAPASALDVTARAHVGVIGARVTFSPGNLADWFLGWFGLDIAEDDVHAWPTSRDRADAAPGPQAHPSRDSRPSTRPRPW